MAAIEDRSSLWRGERPSPVRRLFGKGVVLLALLGAALAAPAAAEDPPEARVAVQADRDVAPVPRRLFGTNLRQNMESDGRIRDFVKQTGITLFRYPDAIDAGYTWDWEAGGVMTRGGRPLISALARFDEAVDLAGDVGAELFYTVKIHDSAPAEAARWVSEARRRGLGGGYWCFGNEPYFPSAEDYIPRDEYVALANRFAAAMKEADPTIRLGIAWGGPYIERHADPGRDSAVLRGTQPWVDFIDFHFYSGRFERESGPDPRRTMAGSLLVAEHTRQFREIFRREAPARAEEIEIHYWEWNGPPWPTLGGLQNLANAIFAADALGEMARHGVAAAIQYNLQEHACGLIPGFAQDWPESWPTETWNGRTVRPVAHALRLWSREMGPVLVETAVEGGGNYQTSDWHTLVNYQGEVPFLAAHATRSEDGSGLQLMLIHRGEKASLPVAISIAGFRPRPEAKVYRLTGPSALSHNDVVDRTLPYRSYADAPDPIVVLEPSTWTGAATDFVYTVPPHSVTVLQLEGG